MAGNRCISSKHRWVKLNVGGKVFLTTKTTLSKEPDSFLSRLIQDDPDLRTDQVYQAKSSIDYMYFLLP